MKSNKSISLGEGTIIGLDLGMSRTGVARMHTIAQIPEALVEINMKAAPFLDQLKQVINEHQPLAIVIGLPRNMLGDDTAQTEWARSTAEEIKAYVDDDMMLFLVDEAGTTKQAEERALPGESVDSVAAGIILEDFMNILQRGEAADVQI